MSEEVAFREGAVIYFENDASGVIFIIRSGRVELARDVADGGVKTLGPGEILGLSDTLGGPHRIGTARAVNNIAASAIGAEEFRRLVGTNVQIGLKVITSLCAELREIDEMIVKRMRGGLAQGLGRAVGLRMIADHFRRKGMTRAARYAYGRYLETNPVGEERLEAAIHLAGLCEKDGEIEVAQSIYSALMQEFPEDARAQASFHRLQNILDTVKGNS